MAIELLSPLISIIPANLLILFEIGVMLIIAAVLAFIAKFLKQPLIPAYIVSGVLIGPLVLNLVKDPHLISVLSDIGVAFLIFIAGLEINFKKLREVGWAASFGGILEILLIFFIGFYLALFLGLSGEVSIYIGLIVAFSSTMVVVKLLSDRKELNSLHGRLIIGILLMQDIAAIISLTILTTDFSVHSIIFALGNAAIFILIAFILSKISNPIFRKAAKNPELLLLSAISFLFLFVIGSFIAKVSLVIGAFFAGVALANSDYKTEIEGKISPLRDFFAVIFFVALGMQLQLITSEYFLLFFYLLGIVLLLKPLIIMFIIRIFGYKKRTSFLTGNSLAQTSEFSLIIATLGFKELGHLSAGLFSTLILLTVVSMSLTTYFIGFEKKFYVFLSWPLNIFSWRHTKKENLEYFMENGKQTILFGCHRMGSLLLKYFQEKKEKIMVVDYDPEIIKSLMDKKIPCVYGDFVTNEVLERVDVRNAEMIISTIPDLEDNILMIKKTRMVNKKVPIFVVANRIDDALELYSLGANYVILPQIIGAQKGFETIKKFYRDKSSLNGLKSAEIRFLKSIHNILY